MTSAVGSAVDEEAEAGASSADGDETSERERSGSTTAEVAGARLGLSGRQVRNLLRQGRLAGEQVGRTWVVDDAAIEDYRTRRAEAG
jgi:excisionase family DNA binding protein